MSSFTGDRVALGSGSITIVTASLAGSTVVPDSSGRAGLKFYNNSTQIVYVGYLSASSSAVQVSPSRFSMIIQSGSFYEEPRPYYGPVSVVWRTLPTTGSLMITELF